MPRSAKQTVHAELDSLRQDAATELIKQRDLEAQLEGAQAEVEQAARAVIHGYPTEDQRAVTQARKAEEAAAAKVEDVAQRRAGAEIRVQRAQQDFDNFQRDHARELLAEGEQSARAIAAELTAAAHALVRLHRAYVAERQIVDQLVAAVPGATPRSDGPPATHPWEAQLKDLERAVAEVREVPAPLPRWQGLEFRRQEDSSARRLQLQRRGKLTAEEQAELERLNLS